MHACYVQASGILACLDYTLAWCFSAGSNVVSVAEHAVMMMLALVRNYIPAYTQVINGEWDVGKIAERAYDLEGKIIGTVGAGRIGQRILKRLQVTLLYPDMFKVKIESIDRMPEHTAFHHRPCLTLYRGSECGLQGIVRKTEQMCTLRLVKESS